MYEDVRSWLDDLLVDNFPKAQVITEITSEYKLSDFLRKNGYQKYFNQHPTFEIFTDVTGIIIHDKRADLFFVECKLQKIQLKDIGQIWGYSKVANPISSLIISPNGNTPSVDTLLLTYDRTDILNYNHNRTIKLAKWDKNKKDMDYGSIIPKGSKLI